MKYIRITLGLFITFIIGITIRLFSKKLAAQMANWIDYYMLYDIYD